MKKGCTEVHPFCLFTVVVLLAVALIVITVRLALILILVVHFPLPPFISGGFPLR